MTKLLINIINISLNILLNIHSHYFLRGLESTWNDTLQDLSSDMDFVLNFYHNVLYSKYSGSFVFFLNTYSVSNLPRSSGASGAASEFDRLHRQREQLAGPPLPVPRSPTPHRDLVQGRTRSVTGIR